MLFSGFLEMLSVSMILPFVDAIMDSEALMNTWLVSHICSLLYITSAKRFLVLFSLVLALMYIFKNLFLVWETNVRVKFVYNCMFRTQRLLFSTYINRPYSYYLNVNSGEILRIILNDTKEAFLLLEILLRFFADVIVSGILILTILIISPIITGVIACVILVTMVIIFRYVRPIVKKAGELNQRSYAKMSTWTLQGIQGIKDLKISQKEKYFEDNFNECGEDFVKSVKTNTRWVQIPRLLIEAGSMSTFFVGSGLLIYFTSDIKELIPVISAVAMAAIRLLPATSRISTQLTDMAYREPMLDKMIDNLCRMQVNTSFGDVEYHTPVIEFTHIGKFQEKISLKNITYRYPSADKYVLNDLNVIIEKGKCIGIIGASGAGKTTLVDLILGLLEPNSGEVLVDGVNIKDDKNGWLSQVGYIPQSIFLLDGSIRENVAFGFQSDEVDDERIWDVLAEAALGDFVHSLPEGLETCLGERGVRLSGGQRQRIGIARALYENPSVLVFDEATSALDNETETAIMDSITKLQGKKTMIIIAHRLTTIENCDMILKVEDGKIYRVR